MNETPLPTDLTEQVTAFHRKFGFSVRDTPTRLSEVPSREIEHRLRLMALEFCAVLRVFGLAMGGSESTISAEITRVIAHRTYGGRIDEIALALANLDCKVESTRLMLGLPRVPVATEVHRANMDKVDVLPPSPVKPDGWEPPKIAELLARETEASEE